MKIDFLGIAGGCGRAALAAEKEPSCRNTLDNEIITLLLVMKVALRKGRITGLPDFSAPYQKQMKVVRRPWFTPEEYKALHKTTGKHAREATRPRQQYEAEELHDYILFMPNTGLRPDEAKNLEYRDVKMVKDDATGEPILLIEVRGKRDADYCKSRPEAVKSYHASSITQNEHLRDAGQGLKKR